MLYEDKVKENSMLKDKLDQLQQMQTAMLAYVLAQNQQLAASLYHNKDNNTASTMIANNTVPQFLMQIMNGG
jgi:hypothetical protein